MEILAALVDRPIRFHFATDAETGALRGAETLGIRREWRGKNSTSRPKAGSANKTGSVDDLLGMPPPSQFLYKDKLIREIESRQTKVCLRSADYNCQHKLVCRADYNSPAHTVR